MANCKECGICKETCPIYRALLRETVSPRGKFILLKKEIKDEVFYLCTLCGNCKRACPWNVYIPKMIRDYREKLIEECIEVDSIKKMVKNILETGNIFGKEDKGRTL
ncbi:4Fe-4S dicluster domain-containing protein [archaeon]|nr:4Fe-4S dicluster domain-containing protein [archaeon]